jgi:hypothetical protein
MKELTQGVSERIYQLPTIDEFQLSNIRIQSNLTDIVLENKKSASIYLVINGE